MTSKAELDDSLQRTSFSKLGTPKGCQKETKEQREHPTGGEKRNSEEGNEFLNRRKREKGCGQNQSINIHD